ncbi:MAG: hypothetical protein WC795_00125 [Candidatus Paceibacterota bacterium]|jgi:hypothetical protein
MIKEFLMKQMMKRQLKGMPQSQQDLIMKVVMENPELFKKIGEEIKAKTKAGMDETAASMTVMRKYQGELAKVMK